MDETFDTDEAAIMFARSNDEGYTVNVTGDACRGDEVMFCESLFAGSWRKPKYAGCRIVRGTIVSDSYGAEKQQHTFTIELADGTRIRRKGRNVYRNLCLARPRDASERARVLEEKHERGDVARRERRIGREYGL